MPLTRLSSSMPDLFVLEHRTQTKPKQNFRTLSFISGEADFYPEDFLTQKDVETVYLRVFTPLMERLYDPAAVQQFKYRDVSLLSCLKKVLFEYVYAIALRFEVLRRASEKIAENLWLEQSRNEEVPYLAQVLSATSLSHSSKIKMLGGNNSSRAVYPILSGAKRPCLNFGPWKSRSVAVYSDPHKSQAVLHALGSAAFLYLNEPAPRAIARSIWNRVPFYCPSRKTVDSQALFKFMASARSTHLFKGLFLNDINAENLLRTRLESTLRLRLFSLMAEIDGFYSFFKGAKALRSALMDEDISASKNAFSQVARAHGVLTVVECHGSLGHPSGYLPLTADRMLAWGNKQKEKLMRWGCPEERIVVTGCSRYDFYKGLDAGETKKNMCRSLGFDSSKPVILVAFPPVNRAYARIVFVHRVWERIHEIVRVISETALEHSETQWILKLHQGDENHSFYESWLKANSAIRNRVRLLTREDPLRLARAADFLIAYWSTYAIDGFALGKPVICAFDSTDDSLEEYRSYGVFDYVENLSELKTAIENRLRKDGVQPSRWDEARRDCLNESDKSAADIVAQFLLTGQQPLPRDTVLSQA